MNDNTSSFSSGASPHRSTSTKRRRSIAVRLVFWFLAISLIPCAILTTITTNIASRSLENSIRNRLVQLAAAKADELEVYALQCVDDGNTLAQSGVIVEAMTKLSANDPTVADAMRVELSDAANALGFSRLLLIDNAGKVVFALGYSHPVEYPIPEGIKIAVEKLTHIQVSGIDRQKVGQVAAEIRKLRKPDPYKQKGIRYVGEVLKKKAGKAGATGAK